MIKKNNNNKVIKIQPSISTTFLMTIIIIAIFLITIFKYSLIYEAASKGEWGTVAVLELPDVLSTISATSLM
tara:strand:+ start:434 stop:649 length:216 start_codon:yes stop_codon:yes gene_type:complete